MRKNAFRSVMVYHNDNTAEIAKYLGVSRVAVSDKLNGRYDFRLAEVDMLAKRWHLTPEQIYEIFIDGAAEERTNERTDDT